MAKFNEFLTVCESPGYQRAKDKILTAFINNPDSYDNDDPHVMFDTYAQMVALFDKSSKMQAKFPAELEKQYNNKLAHLFDDSLRVQGKDCVFTFGKTSGLVLQVINFLAQNSDKKDQYKAQATRLVEAVTKHVAEINSEEALFLATSGCDSKATRLVIEAALASNPDAWTSEPNTYKRIVNYYLA